MARKNRGKRKTVAAKSPEREHLSNSQGEPDNKRTRGDRSNRRDRTIELKNNVVANENKVIIKSIDDTEQDVEVDVTTVKEEPDDFVKDSKDEQVHVIHSQNHRKTSESENLIMSSHGTLDSIKTEDFDTSYEMSDTDLLPSVGISDSIEMPFHDLDMLNILQFKTDNGLNDALYFTPVSSSSDAVLKIEDLPMSSQASDLRIQDSILGTIKSEPPDEFLSDSATIADVGHVLEGEIDTITNGKTSDRKTQNHVTLISQNDDSSNNMESVNISSPTMACTAVAVGGEEVGSQGSVVNQELASQLGHSSRLAFLLLKDRVIKDDNVVLSNGIMNINSFIKAAQSSQNQSGTPPAISDENLDEIDRSKPEKQLPIFILQSDEMGQTTAVEAAPNIERQGTDEQFNLVRTSAVAEDEESLDHIDDEVDRFVICSDSTMECYLCSFATESYSAFKSHIICSHPCWRITKKLSKNRLLVEKKLSKGKLLVESSGGGIGGSRHRKIASKGGIDERELGELAKKCTRNPKKRQIYERNKRLFKCAKCLRLFVFEGSVVNHVIDHHREQKPYDHIYISNNHGESFGPIYRCQHQYCYFSCGTDEELVQHNKTNHLQVVYRCQLCGFTSNSADSVKDHGIQMHNLHLA